jgi:hypothetical protein
MKKFLFFSILFFISLRAFTQYCEGKSYIIILYPFHYNDIWGKNCIIYDDSLFRHKEHDSLLIPESKKPIGFEESMKSDTLGVSPNDSVVFYYPETKFPYYIISNKVGKTKITFYDLFSDDRRTLLLNNEDFSYETIRMTWNLPPYPDYDSYVINKTRDVFYTKKRCFSTEANDSCISIHVRDIHKRTKSTYHSDTNYSYYYVTVDVKNNCEIDRANYCLNIAQFHQDLCYWADNFLTNNIDKYEVIYNWRDCTSNLGSGHTLKPGEQITYDSLRVRVRNDACVNNMKCRIGFVYMTDELRKKGNLSISAYIKYRKNNEGIIWSDEFCFE